MRNLLWFHRLRQPLHPSDSYHDVYVFSASGIWFILTHNTSSSSYEVLESTIYVIISPLHPPWHLAKGLTHRVLAGQYSFALKNSDGWETAGSQKQHWKRNGAFGAWDIWFCLEATSCWATLAQFVSLRSSFQTCKSGIAQILQDCCENFTGKWMLGLLGVWPSVEVP